MIYAMFIGLFLCNTNMICFSLNAIEDICHFQEGGMSRGREILKLLNSRLQNSKFLNFRKF